MAAIVKPQVVERIGALIFPNQVPIAFEVIPHAGKPADRRAGQLIFPCMRAAVRLNIYMGIATPAPTPP